MPAHFRELRVKRRLPEIKVLENGWRPLAEGSYFVEPIKRVIKDNPKQTYFPYHSGIFRETRTGPSAALLPPVKISVANPRWRSHQVYFRNKGINSDHWMTWR